MPARIGRAIPALILALLVVVPVLVPVEARQVPHPSEVFGFEPGEDYKLADFSQVHEYYERLAASSDRIQLIEIGRSTQGRPMLLLFISSEANLEQLERWRSISERLARAEDLTEQEARRLARQGKAIVWIDAGLHATEVAHAQHAPLLAHHLVTDESEETRRFREDVVLLLMPVMNPDGLDIVTEWYRKNLGTPFETTAPPELYQEYVGHDNNRDWFMMRQQETRAVADVLYHQWYPQIIFNHHQTAPFPARIFIPPFADPVNPHIPPLVVRGVNMVGEHMAKRFEEEEMSGVVSRMTFTMWWNGGMRTAPYFHNMVGILAEVGHNSATPQYHDPESLPETFGTGSHAISAKEPSVYYANPWKGGWARLEDAVSYHFTASLATLDIASKLKEDWLFNVYRMGRSSIEAGEAGEPYAYVLPADDQWDIGEAVELIEVLRRGGIDVHRAEAAFEADGERYPAGSYVVYAGQAFRPYLMDLLEKQEHPHREQYPGGPPQPPYDGAGWTLPIMMGVNVKRVERPFGARTSPIDMPELPPGRVAGADGYGYLLSRRRNASSLAVNRLLAAGEQVSWAVDGFEVAGASYDAGTLVVEARGDGTREHVARLAEDLGLEFVGIASLPEVELEPLGQARVGLYRPWTANMDEGWTRWLLEQYEFPLTSLTDQDIRSADLSAYDVIMLADQTQSSILNGHPPGRMPEAYVGGIGVEGAAALKRFVEGGGRLVTFDAASDFAIQQLSLPLTNAVSDASSDDLFVPGSLVRLRVAPEHAVAYGMPTEAGAFFDRSRTFMITSPARAGDNVADAPPVEVIARYGSENLLLSGWELGAQRYLANRPAVVRAGVGDGDVVLIGFRPQFRAQPSGTFKLVFNAIHGATVPERAVAHPVAADADSADYR